MPTEAELLLRNLVDVVRVPAEEIPSTYRPGSTVVGTVTFEYPRYVVWVVDPLPSGITVDDVVQHELCHIMLGHVPIPARDQAEFDERERQAYALQHEWRLLPADPPGWEE
jgi:hypothetical protein